MNAYVRFARREVNLNELRCVLGVRVVIDRHEERCRIEQGVQYLQVGIAAHVLRIPPAFGLNCAGAVMSVGHAGCRAAVFMIAIVHFLA